MEVQLIHKKLQQLTNDWPATLVVGLEKYIESAKNHLVRTNNLDEIDDLFPYWFHLPGYLLDLYSAEHQAVESGFLEDIIWAQYCLFFKVRIADDLYDGDTEVKNLIYVCDMFQLEAERLFSLHLSHSSAFWKSYRSALKRTIEAIVQVEEQQKSLESDKVEMLSAAGDVAAILNIGSAAVCAYCNHQDDFNLIQDYANYIAIASQILDDMEDLTEDLTCGRYNYVARFLLEYRDSTIAEADDAIQKCRSILESTDALNNLFCEIDLYFVQAQRAVETLDLEEARDLAERYRVSVENTKQSFHLNRVRSIFGDLTGT